MSRDFARFRFSIMQNEGLGMATVRVRFSPFMATQAGVFLRRQNPTFQPVLADSGMLLQIPASSRRNQVIMSDCFTKDKIQKVMSGTLRLQTEFEYRDSKLGAGILYDKEGHIMTSAHNVSYFKVLSPGTSAKHWVAGKVVANFKGGEQFEAEVLSLDVGNDVALLKIPESVITSNTPCDFSADVPGMGDNFFVVGQPKVAPFYVRYGHVSDPSRSPSDIPADILNDFPHSLEHMDPAMKFLELDVMAGPGFSGGPLSTVEGVVFGVLHAGIPGIACYGIPFAIIKSALDRMFKRSLGDNVFCHLN